jgi:peptidoglycan/xylan/chitin deacetylase (PgdA/CDA1 family)
MATTSDEREATPGSFVLTLDTELIWGSFDHMSAAEFEARYPDVRSTIRALVEMFDRYEMAATWAVLGHVFLRECHRGADGSAHPELVHPEQSWFSGDWLAADPCTDRERDPLWYGDDVLDLIQSARTPQEIGCHSFSHALFDDPALTAEAIRSDLGRCIELARGRGLELRSFVFPRNREGHHELLREHGFRAFRGVDPTWHASVPGPAGRAAHLLDQGMALPPPVSHPVERLPGLWDVPGSMLFMHRSGLRRAVPLGSRVLKAKIGLRRATGGRVFHLWTHPFNVASDPRGLLRALEEIVRYAVRLRDLGRIRIETMAGVADRSAAGSGG